MYSKTPTPWNTLFPLLPGQAPELNQMIKNAEKNILSYLKKNKEGETFSGIAKALGMHRHTATKYIYKLIGEGKIKVRNISTAKVCILSGGEES